MQKVHDIQKLWFEDDRLHLRVAGTEHLFDLPAITTRFSVQVTTPAMSIFPPGTRATCATRRSTAPRAINPTVPERPSCCGCRSARRRGPIGSSSPRRLEGSGKSATQ